MDFYLIGSERENMSTFKRVKVAEVVQKLPCSISTVYYREICGSTEFPQDAEKFPSDDENYSA